MSGFAEEEKLSQEGGQYRALRLMAVNRALGVGGAKAKAAGQRVPVGTEMYRTDLKLWLH